MSQPPHPISDPRHPPPTATAGRCLPPLLNMALIPSPYCDPVDSCLLKTCALEPCLLDSSRILPLLTQIIWAVTMSTLRLDVSCSYHRKPLVTECDSVFDMSSRLSRRTHRVHSSHRHRSSSPTACFLYWRCCSLKQHVQLPLQWSYGLSLVFVYAHGWAEVLTNTGLLSDDHSRPQTHHASTRPTSAQSRFASGPRLRLRLLLSSATCGT